MAHFIDRHVGPSERDINYMLQSIGVSSLDELIEECVPQKIRTATPLNLPDALSEQESLQHMTAYAQKNKIWRSYIGLGYHNTITPSVILRNLLENPGWYTSYTPYQAEISQGRLEALLIFQTMVQDLTGMGMSNSSLLDEATAAAEAMTMAHRYTKGKQGNRIFVSERCHAHSIALLQTRAQPIDIEVIVGDHNNVDIENGFFAAIVQYPDTTGSVQDYRGFFEKLHANQGIAIVATDILALTKLTPPGEFGADIVIGNTQRFGVPLGYGGPHAAFLATHDDKKWARHMPGRIIGVSTDADGNRALRMALQVREQHIKRQKATSNICTAQALLANVASMYAVWHGPEGLLHIANRIHCHTLTLAQSLRQHGYIVNELPVFDSITVSVTKEQKSNIQQKAQRREINYRYGSNSITIAFDETTSVQDVIDVCETFDCMMIEDINEKNAIDGSLFQRKSSYLTHSIFHSHRSETEMMRYLHHLETKDLALNKAMIPLGSCTMKLNAATEMIPITWSGFGGIHPYAPKEQALGYAKLFEDLESWLSDITGFDAISLQPNAGSQGEYAGLLCIRQYHASKNQPHRNICLIPTSAHGTNPASAVMAGMDVVAVKCDDDGNIDMVDLERLAIEHKENLAALMVTYPSTHGVFEETIIDVCRIIHDNGGQVYMDGANMNAIVGLCRPGEIGADVCHLNLHKTFCIPHGGGGPGMGPIGVKSHLAPFLPRNPLAAEGGSPVSAAPYGSPSILPISWSYIAMCGAKGLTHATKIAILSANYIATRLKEAYPILYTGKNGRIAHECILDVRHFLKTSHVSVEDIAKRLIDYGFHAPTMSWPVTGTLMVEPTESEPLKELDRFIEAMLSIRSEITQIEEGMMPYENSTLHNAPHTANVLMLEEWPFPYSRQVAVFPSQHTKEQKYWPSVRRVDNTYGDKNLACSCQAWMPEEIAAK